MDDLTNAMRREAERVMGNVAAPRFATVSSYDPNTYAVKVLLQPEGVETGWCPVAVPQVGNGYGIHVPPHIGDQAVVVFQEGEVETPVVVGFVYSDGDRPRSVPAGDVQIVHESGAKLILKPGGVVEIYGTDIKVGPENATLRTLVNQLFRAHMDNHSHPGNNAPPTQKMTDAMLTTALKAG